MRLLLLEDDEMLGEGLRDYLGADGHVVDWCRSLGDTQALRGEPFDALLVDWQLPDGSGLDWLRARRARGDRTPALMLTARDRLVQRIEGLDAGADDYLVKPFAIAELRARVRALGRRREREPLAVLKRGDVELDFDSRRAYRAGLEVSLTAREWAIVELLARAQGRVVARDALLAEVWGEPSEAANASLGVLMSRIRRKLGHELIRLVRGEGHALG